MIGYNNSPQERGGDEMQRLIRELAGPAPVARAALCQTLQVDAETLQTQLAALEREGLPVLSTEQGVWLDPARSGLLPARWQPGLETDRLGRGTVFYAPEMDSTNSVLKREATAHVLAEGSLALCERQTAGRGRLQRVWEDPEPGANLKSSVLLRPTLPPAQIPLITLAVATAAADAIAEQGLAPGIKWPNDVVLGARKCVGILCELATDPQGAVCVVAGAGVNLNQTVFPDALQGRATSLKLETGREVAAGAFLTRYLLHLEAAVDTLCTQGFAGLLPAYQARSVTLGRRVQVVGAAETFTGLAETLDETGALWVRDDAGTRRRVLSGDVSVRGVMGYV